MKSLLHPCQRLYQIRMFNHPRSPGLRLELAWGKGCKQSAFGFSVGDSDQSLALLWAIYGIFLIEFSVLRLWPNTLRKQARQYSERCAKQHNSEVSLTPSQPLLMAHDFNPLRERFTGVDWHAGVLAFYLHCNRFGLQNHQGTGRVWSLDFGRALFGQFREIRKEVASSDGVLVLEEAKYLIRVITVESAQERVGPLGRLLNLRIVSRREYSFEARPGIPVPPRPYGEDPPEAGTNHARLYTHKMTTAECWPLYEVIEKLRLYVTDRRDKEGGKGWKPEAFTPHVLLRAVH